MARWATAAPWLGSRVSTSAGVGLVVYVRVTACDDGGAGAAAIDVLEDIAHQELRGEIGTAGKIVG